MVEDLQRVAGEIGRSPPIEAYGKHGEYNYKTCKRRWGNWNSVLKQAGLEPTDHSEHWKDNDPVQFEKRYGTVEVECSNCEGTVKRRPYSVEQHSRFYCDMNCKREYMSTQTGKNSRVWAGGNTEIECEVCGAVTEVKQAEKDTSRFCSQDCMIEWRSETFVGENHQRWKDNTKELYYGANWPEQREKARERDNYECQVCGMDETTHVGEFGSAHDVHHIVRFRTFDSYKEANKLENLITLCMRCHQHVENGNTTVPQAIWHRNKNRKVAR